MICPRCGQEQSESEECAACGIVIRKYVARQAAPPARTDAAVASHRADSTDLEAMLVGHRYLFIEQKAREWLEILLDWEQANQYRVSALDGATLGAIRETSSGVLSALARVFLGSHRPLHVEVFTTEGYVAIELTRPFFFIFSNLDVVSPDGVRLGTVRRRFGLLYKKYDLMDAQGHVFARIASPLWRLWTFPILDAQDHPRGVISKKWSGLGQEYLTDADNFRLDFGEAQWTTEQRAVIFAATLSVDFDFFENNRGAG